MKNIRNGDKLLKRRTGLSNPRMIGANNTSVSNQHQTSKLLNTITSN